MNSRRDIRVRMVREGNRLNRKSKENVWSGPSHACRKVNAPVGSSMAGGSSAAFVPSRGGRYVLSSLPSGRGSALASAGGYLQTRIQSTCIL